MNKIFGKREEVAAIYVDLDTKALSLVLVPGASMSDQTIADLAVQVGYRIAKYGVVTRTRQRIVRGDWRDSVAPLAGLFRQCFDVIVLRTARTVDFDRRRRRDGGTPTAAIPGIMWLSAHKDILFALSGGLMAASTLLWWQQRHAPCPVDPIKAAACARLRRINVWLRYQAPGWRT